MKPLKHISQETLDSRTAPRSDDAFEHEALAHTLYKQFVDADDGSVFAIDAQWGRGKSDVLHRVAYLHNKMWDGVDESGQEIQANLLENPLRALWITPWLTKDSNLMGEIVLECMKRASQARSNNSDAYTEVKRLSQFLIYASLGLSESYAQGNLANYLQAKHLIRASQREVVSSQKNARDLVDEIFKVFDSPDSGEALETMPQIFAKIVRQLIELTPPMKEDGAKEKLLIFIDDIDRCLPHQQVELLEAIHFLTTSNAPVIFFMAIDSNLAAKALATHYQIRDNDFAPLLYLDKIIDTRVALSAAPIFKKLFQGLMRVQDANRPETLEERVTDILKAIPNEGATDVIGYSTWEDEAIGSIRGPRNLNPRAWQKIFEVFRIALRDDQDEVIKWIEHPETFWPWACLRVRHYSIAQRVMAFFGPWEVSLPETSKRANAYANFVSGLGLGLERFIDRRGVDEDGGGESIDSASMQIASLLAASGLHRRLESDIVEKFMEEEYVIIKAFERSCERQGLGSVMRHDSLF